MPCKSSGCIDNPKQGGILIPCTCACRRCETLSKRRDKAQEECQKLQGQVSHLSRNLKTLQRVNKELVRERDQLLRIVGRQERELEADGGCTCDNLWLGHQLGCPNYRISE